VSWCGVEPAPLSYLRITSPTRYCYTTSHGLLRRPHNKRCQSVCVSPAGAVGSIVDGAVASSPKTQTNTCSRETTGNHTASSAPNRPRVAMTYAARLQMKQDERNRLYHADGHAARNQKVCSRREFAASSESFSSFAVSDLFIISVIRSNELWSRLTPHHILAWTTKKQMNMTCSYIQTKTSFEMLKLKHVIKPKLHLLRFVRKKLCAGIIMFNLLVFLSWI